ncbi:MAG: MlaC/ttg2D family ABC transporter substrate-binding protein [Gammaproteobacteria bacterium]
MIRHYILMPLFVLLLPLSTAAENLSPAQQIIENSSLKINRTLKQEAYHQNFDKAADFVDSVVTDFVDMEKVAILVLGKNIRKSTPEQRRRFIHEFKTLLVRTYTRAFLEYTEWEVTFPPHKSEPAAKKTLVKTQVLQPGKVPVKIDYRMIKDKRGEWKVYDIIIEGISLVTNYRASFNREINQTGSLESVIESLVSKNNKSGDVNS